MSDKQLTKNVRLVAKYFDVPPEDAFKAARNAALEEAAMVAGDLSKLVEHFKLDYTGPFELALEEAAFRIRELKTKEKK